MDVPFISQVVALGAHVVMSLLKLLSVVKVEDLEVT
jgi:hypothetical protein